MNQRTTTVDGRSIAWVHHTPSDGIQASGPAIVVLHGLGSSSREFRYLADHPTLRDRKMIAVDALGFGDSDRPADWPYTIEAHADIIASVIRQVTTPPVALVGHSMGGSIAIALTSRHPDIVERLIVAEPNLDPGVGTLSSHISRQSETRFVARGYQALVYQTEREAARGDAVAARFLVTLRQASPVALYRSAASLLADRTPTLREQFEGFRLPRAILWGALTPPLAPPLLDAAIRHLTVADAGHVMMIENPDGFAQAVADAVTHLPSPLEGS